MQSTLIAALCDKVRSRQYAVEQVLFELFQNADDAATQLAEMRGTRDQRNQPTSSRCDDFRSRRFVGSID